MNSNRSEPSAEQKVREYLTFFIAEVEWALGLEHVREVIPYDTVTRVPGMPKTVRGVTNLRGSVVPVLDLAIKFDLPPIEITSRTCVVLVEVEVATGPMLLGLLIEEVGQVLALPNQELLPAPSFGTPVHVDYLEGVLPLGKKFGLVLDINRTLSQEEILSPKALSVKASEGTPATPETAPEPALDDAWDGDAEPAAPPTEAVARDAAC